jgi:hypothetical protein
MTYEYAVLCRREAAMVLPSADSHRGTQLSSLVAIEHTRPPPPSTFLKAQGPRPQAIMKTF